MVQSSVSIDDWGHVKLALVHRTKLKTQCSGVNHIIDHATALCPLPRNHQLFGGLPYRKILTNRASI